MTFVTNSDVYDFLYSLESPPMIVDVDGLDTVVRVGEYEAVLYNHGEWADLIDGFGRVVDFESDTVNVFDTVKGWVDKYG